MTMALLLSTTPAEEHEDMAGIGRLRFGDFKPLLVEYTIKLSRGNMGTLGLRASCTISNHSNHKNIFSDFGPPGYS